MGQFFLGLIVVVISQGLAARSLVTARVGSVDGRVVTSREVVASLYVESAIFDSPEPPVFDKRIYKNKVTAVLIEWIVFLEAKSFDFKDIPLSDVQKAIATVRIKLKQNLRWNELEVSKEELEEIIRRKLKAKQFIKFKAEGAQVPVSDEEAKAYYDSNQEKFGALPLSELTKNIKIFLKKRQVDERLKAWFDVLRSKYKVKNGLV